MHIYHLEYYWGRMEGGNDMTAADRRMENISILVVSGHITVRELAQEFDVSRRTILNDIVALSYGYPIYTKQGAGGGVFIMDSYKPYNNTLTIIEQERLKKCMIRQREKIKKFWNVSSGNMVLISWNCSRIEN